MAKLAEGFLTDIAELRRGARKHIEAGAVTDGYKAGPKGGDPAPE